MAHSLRVDPKKGDQLVRGKAVMPFGLGRQEKIAFISVDPENKEIAKKCGIDLIVNDSTIEDVLIAHQLIFTLFFQFQHHDPDHFITCFHSILDFLMLFPDSFVFSSVFHFFSSFFYLLFSPSFPLKFFRDRSKMGKLNSISSSPLLMQPTS